MRIAVASGKGGTGKTTVAVNLALTAARSGLAVHLCDCDVEEPNARLFLDVEFGAPRDVTVPVPVVDAAICSHCGSCAEICAFNAIACLPDRTLVFVDLCHSCGGCWLACPRAAIAQGSRSLGELASGAGRELSATQGVLRVGETVVPPLIRAVKAAAGSAPWVILDAPPGTACPVVETMKGVDYVLLVTEPTPFGLHDLELAVRLTRALGLPCGVVVNRAGATPDLIDDFCGREGLAVLARIPFRRAVAAACAEGRLAIEADEDVAAAMAGLFHSLRDREVAV
jgi:MinD superfamily P-loop ATPase